jgi:acyl-ACP thioesterase
MTDISRHRESYLVRAYETDPYGHASMRTLLLLLQEAATGHAERLGLAVPHLIDSGIAWVLSRLRLEVGQWPCGGDTVTVETWPHAASRIVIERRFRILDPSDRELAAASTLWVVLDLERRRPIRLPPFIVDAMRPLVGDRRPPSPDSIPIVAEPDVERTFEVRYADLDMVHHVNNAVFVQWATETTPEELWSDHLPARVDAHFLSECRLGDSVTSHAQRAEGPAGGEYLHLLRRQSDGAEVLRARSVWEPTGGTP